MFFSMRVIVQDWKDCLQVAYSGSTADLTAFAPNESYFSPWEKSLF